MAQKGSNNRSSPTSRLYRTWNMFPPGSEAVSIDFSTSFTVWGLWLILLKEPKDAVDDDPFSVDEPVLAVGDVPRGGVWELCGVMPKRRRGLAWGLSFRLGSLSTTARAVYNNIHFLVLLPTQY